MATRKRSYEANRRKLGEYDHARQMSKITADYLSYIFRNTSEMVSVSAETEHCQNYLKILLLRYPNRFDYYVEVHEEVQDASILPFLIQVFVENTAQHALTLEEKILISVTVYPEDREEGKYVNKIQTVQIKMGTNLKFQIIHLYLLFLQFLFIQRNFQFSNLVNHVFKFIINLLQFQQIPFRQTDLSSEKYFDASTAFYAESGEIR